MDNLSLITGKQLKQMGGITKDIFGLYYLLITLSCAAGTMNGIVKFMQWYRNKNRTVLNKPYKIFEDVINDIKIIGNAIYYIVSNSLIYTIMGITTPISIPLTLLFFPDSDDQTKIY